MSRIQWVAEIVCEYGGPAIVASARDYEKWTGNAPFSIEERRVLHYWGQFTDQLPEPYREDGGHVYREADSLDALRADRDALIKAIEATFPGAKATVDEEEGEAHVLLPDDRQMWIEFSPKSQYELACEGDVVWEHSFTTKRGSEGTGLFWDFEGAGAFWVGVSAGRDELVLLRTWVDEEEFETTAKAHVDSPPEDEEGTDEIALEVTEGPIVVGYSPHHWLGILGAEQLQAVMAEVQGGMTKEQGLERLVAAFRTRLAPATGDNVVMLSSDEEEDVAAVLSLQPGRYAISVGRYDPDEGGWSCIWCRFKRPQN